MNYNDHRRAKAAQNFGLLHWPFLLFLTAVFFLNYHDLTNNYHGLPSSQGQINDLNTSVDNITDAIDQGSVTRRITLLSLGIVAFVSVVLYRDRLRLWPDGSLGWLILGFVALAFISPIWAEDLPLTFRRLVVFAIFCIAAVAVASRYSLREIVWWAFCSSGLYLLIGIVAEVAYGALRPFEFGYRFAGTLHPNTQGINCVLLLLSALAVADAEERKRTLLRVCALLGSVFLILTASRAACGTGAVAFAVYWAAVDRRWPKVALALALGSVLGLSLLVERDATVSELGRAAFVGRDDSSITSLSGRIGIWQDVIKYVRKRPVLGYGYCAFWTPARISEVSWEENWAVPHSHSVYVEYLLGLGSVGLGLYTLLLVAGIRRAFALHRFSQNPAFAFCGALMVFYALEGFFECPLFEGSLMMFLCMVVLVRLGFVYVQEASSVGRAQKLRVECYGLHAQLEEISIKDRTPIRFQRRVQHGRRALFRYSDSGL